MLIGQADQPRVREMRWIEPKKETDKIFCVLSRAKGHAHFHNHPQARVNKREHVIRWA
jgi:hypothetical protein